MLPAHAYPELKTPASEGEFRYGLAKSEKELDGIPGAVLFTTNCLMPPEDSYADRVFTTAVVGYPGLVHILGG